MDNPRILLHDHLDGGIRPQTAYELTSESGVPLPQSVEDSASLDRWLIARSDMDLTSAFERFALPIAVMQTEGTLRRVAAEAVVDLAADGVRYAEIRFAPHLHTEGGLVPDRVVSAVLEGFSAVRSGLEARLILCAMRTRWQTEELVDLALRWFGQGVVGVDLAGPEPGFPVAPHAPAFRRAASGGLGVTIHAGEMDGPDSVAAAVRLAAASRIGHGWRLIDDCVVRDGEIADVGPIATEVLSRAIPLEICLTSNRCLGLDFVDHPVLKLLRAGFRITINTDDRTITRCSLGGELTLFERLGATPDELQRVHDTAVMAAFDVDAARFAGKSSS